MPQELQERGISWDPGYAAAVLAQTGDGKRLRSLEKKNPLGSWLCNSIICRLGVWAQLWVCQAS